MELMVRCEPRIPQHAICVFETLPEHELRVRHALSFEEPVYIARGYAVTSGDGRDA